MYIHSILLLLLPVIVTGVGVAEADRDRDKDGDPGTGTTGTSRIEWYSDQGQDRLLMEQVLQGLRGGYFVELGASDGISSKKAPHDC